MKRVLLQPAYVLHRRPYRESSFLVELFTKEYGRLTVIAKGMRHARKSMLGSLQAFTPLLISWVGKQELMTLTHLEPNGEANYLQGESLFAGFYLNELLLYLLEKWDAHPSLYVIYESTLLALQAPPLNQALLRSFEKYLLEEIGYGLLAKSDITLHDSFIPEKYYRFIPEQGFMLSELGDISQAKVNIFSGKSLRAIIREEWEEDDVLLEAKRLMRIMFASLLGAKPIHSRKLFASLTENGGNFS